MNNSPNCDGHNEHGQNTHELPKPQAYEFSAGSDQRLMIDPTVNALTVDGVQTETLWLDPAQRLYNAWQTTCQINEEVGNVYNGGWAAVDHQFFEVVESEFNELKKGIQERDIHELRDGIGDLLFTVIGLAYRAGLDSIADLEEVVRANLRKFDYSTADAEKTQLKYAQLQVETHQATKEVSPGLERIVTFSSRRQIDVKGKEHGANKWLKSHNWTDVNFGPLPDGNRLSEITEKVPLVTSPAFQEAAELLTASAPIDVITNYLKQYDKVRVSFTSWTAAIIAAAFRAANTNPTLRRGCFVVNGRPLRDAIAYRVQDYFSKLLYADELPDMWHDQPQAREELHAYRDLIGLIFEAQDSVEVNGVIETFSKAIIAHLPEPGDRVAFARALDALCEQLAREPDGAQAWADGFNAMWNTDTLVVFFPMRMLVAHAIFFQWSKGHFKLIDTLRAAQLLPVDVNEDVVQTVKDMLETNLIPQ
jgi:hypothetical protein